MWSNEVTCIRCQTRHRLVVRSEHKPEFVDFTCPIMGVLTTMRVSTWSPTGDDSVPNDSVTAAAHP